MNIKENNRLIAELFGYTYYHPGVEIDDSECGGIYNRFEIFSKIPIMVDEYGDDECYFARLPNPDYGNKVNPKWNNDIEKLEWSTLNYSEYIRDLKYHKSWNWLMPAYIKCLTTMKELWDVKGKKDVTGFMTLVKDLNQCTCLLGEINGVHDEETMKKATYKAVVEFAKWFKENKNNG